MAALGGTQTGERFGQLGLAIALHAGNSQDLAFAHFKGYIVHGFQPAVILHVQIFDVKNFFLWLGFALFDLENDLAANHHG